MFPCVLRLALRAAQDDELSAALDRPENAQHRVILSVREADSRRMQGQRNGS
jgi:hypothetical protein